MFYHSIRMVTKMLCVCSRMCGCTNVFAVSAVCTQTWGPVVSLRYHSLECYPPYVWNWDPLWDLGLTDLVKLTGQQVLGIYLSLGKQGFQAHIIPHWLFYVGSGTQIQNPMLIIASTVMTELSPSPDPRLEISIRDLQRVSSADALGNWLGTQQDSHPTNE